MATILITGGSGIIGSALIPQLTKKGHVVRVLSRTKSAISGAHVFSWDIDQELIEEGALENVDHIIHLSGYNVSEGRWTKRRKKQIEDSRIKAVAILKKHLKDHKLKSFISASGVSYYGTVTSDKIFTEDHLVKFKNTDYLAWVSHQWEHAAHQFAESADRIVILRTPVVLSYHGGALEKIAAPIKKGFGAVLGSGKQWMPWVHINDLVQAYSLAIENTEMKGVFNISAPEHTSNREFTHACARTLNKKIWLPPVPGFLLKLYFGAMAKIVLEGSRVSGEKITSPGFDYEFKELRSALSDLLKK